MQTQRTDRVLSPMFLTHVECTGCHIERVARKSGVLDSYGTVAKAVHKACDKCHEEGTGQQYILMALSCIFRFSRILKPLARPFSFFEAEH